MIIVYSYYVMDIIHIGHLEMLRNAKAMAGKDGKLIVGILTDEAVMEKKKKPIISFSDRVSIARSIECIDLVVAQNTYSPLNNVKEIKPDILMESSSHSSSAIQQAEDVMKTLGGRVVIIPYFPGQSSTEIKKKVRQN
jgi:glycerol-3-phosphate cytidylyltransferase